jgi:hypothetical protein
VEKFLDSAETVIRPGNIEEPEIYALFEKSVLGFLDVPNGAFAGFSKQAGKRVG